MNKGTVRPNHTELLLLTDSDKSLVYIGRNGTIHTEHQLSTSVTVTGGWAHLNVSIKQHRLTLDAQCEWALSTARVFWHIWFINQRALYNHALSVVIGIIIGVHRWHHHHLCKPPPGTGLDRETSYLEYTCTYAPHVCTSNI